MMCKKFMKCTIKKCLNINNDVNLDLLQTTSMPMGARLPSTTTMLFSRPLRGLLPKMSWEPMKINNDDTQYEAFQALQDKYVKNNDNHKDLLSFHIESTAAMQHEDGGPLAHRVIKEANISDHRGRFCISRVMKSGWQITLNMRHICSTPVTTEQYLWK